MSRNTPGEGAEYEVHVPAYFALKLNQHKEVKNFILQSNVPGFQNLDDVVISVEMENGNIYNYAIQLKHKENNKRLIPANFTAQGDFNLEKYCNAFKKLSNTHKKYSVILYSNINFDDARKGEVEDFIMADAKYQDPYFNPSFFNQSTGPKGMYEFCVKDSFKGTQALTKQDFEDFFLKFNLFVCQKKSRSVEKSIIDIFVKEYHAKEEIAVNFINVFRKWHKGEFTDKKLDKNVLNIHIIDLLISSFVITPPLVVPSNDQKLLEESCRCFDIVVFNDSKENFVKQLGTNGSQRFFGFCNNVIQSLPNDLLKLGKNSKLVDRFVSSLTQSDTQKIFQYIYEEPIFLEFTEKSKNIIYKLTSLMPMLSNKIKFILVGHNVDIQRFISLKVFSTLENLSVVSGDLFERTKKSMKIVFHGKNVFLENLLDLYPEVSSLIRVEHLFSMVQENFIVGEKIENLPGTYLSRTVSAVYLDTETFLDYSLTSKDVMIMNCANNYEIMKNLIARKGINIVEIHEFDDSHDHEIVLSKNETSPIKVFDEISSKTKRKIHIVKAINTNLCMLVLTNENVSELKHLTLDGPSITETDIHSYLNNPINFLCAQPGMGKSTMLKYLKNTCSIDYWPISVDIRQHNSFLKEKPSGPEVLKYFFMKTLKNKDPFTKTLSEIFLEKKMLCLFLDGLDELDNQSLSNILDIVKEIADMGCRVWISSRENIHNKIENEINVFSITINQISEMQRNEYITKRLELKYTQEEINTILIKISKSCNIVNNGRILGVPLQLFLLTEIFLQGEKYQGELDENFFLITKMYLVYFRGRWKHFVGKLESESEHMLEELLDIKLAQYEIPALQSLFDLEFHNFSVDKNNTHSFLKGIEAKGDQLGIITKFDDAKKPVFDHVTYAEFFACRWLCKNPKEIVKLESCLFTDKYQNFKLILDTMLCEDRPLHLAVIYKNMSQFERYLKDERCPTEDRMGRTPLHLACSYGTRYPTLKTDKLWHRLDNDDIDIAIEKEYEKMFQHLLKLFNSAQKDKLFQWNSLDYCIASQCLLAIELILRHDYGSEFSFSNNDSDFLKNECSYLCMKFEEIYDVDIQHELTLAYYSSKYGFEHVFFVLKYTESLPSEINGLHFLLHLAAWGNHKQIIDYLLQLNVDINATNYNYETPLHLATKASNKDIINLLINNGASVNGSLILPPALKYANNKEIFELLLHRGADIHYQNYNKRNLLHFAAEEGKAEIVKMLINRGLSVNTTDVDALTPLHLAAEQGHHEVVEILLKEGADVNALTNKKRTPLHLAAIRGSSDTIGILIESGVETNAQDIVGATALHLAIEFKCLEAVQILLERGAKPNVKTNRGENSLHYAARGGNVKTIDLLIQHNVDVNAEDCQGVTPLHLAAKHRHYQAVKLLFHQVDLFINQVMESLFTENSQVTNNFEQRLVSLDATQYSKERSLWDLQERCKTDIKLYLRSNENTILSHLKALYREQVLRFYDNTEDSDFVPTENKELMVDYLKKKQKEEISLYLGNGSGALIRLWEETYVKLCSYFEIEGENLTHALPFADKQAIFNHLKERLRIERKVILSGSKSSILNYLETKHRGDVELFSDDSNDVITEHLEAEFKKVLGLNKNSKLKEATLLYLKKKYRTEIEFLLYGNPKHKRSLLHYAAQGGNIEIIDFVLKSGVKSHIKDEDGITALHLAVKFHHFEGVKLLLKRDFGFSRVANKDDTPLHYACKDGVLDIVRLLVKRGGLNAGNKDNVTPLHLAVKYRRMPTIQYLIECGATVNVATTNGDTPLHYAATEGISEIVEILLNHGAEINVSNNDGLTPLHMAVKDGYLRVTAQLIDKGANIKVVTNKRETLLHYASIKGHIPLMELLLYERDVDINAVDVDGITAFHLCAGQKNNEAVTLLIESKADFKKITKKNETTLHYAVRSGAYETVTRLVQMGVDINYKNVNNESALLLALEQGYSDTVKFLLDRGADINVVSKNGDNALHYVARSGNCRVLDMVLENDIDLNSQNKHGATPLHVAVEHEHYAFVLKLLERGADVNIKMKNGNTPLMLANVTSNFAMKALLEKFGAQNS